MGFHESFALLKNWFEGLHYDIEIKSHFIHIAPIQNYGLMTRNM